MIKIALIAPTKLIEPYGNRGDFHLALSHLMSPTAIMNEYEVALTESKLPIILDNGLFENGKPEPLDTLITKAHGIKAHTVFAPDILYKRADTEDAFEEAVEALNEFKKHTSSALKLAAVVQADNVKDFIESYEHFAQHPEVALIGLSILSVPKSFAELTGTDDISDNRLRCLQELNVKAKHFKSTHLLGAGNHYRDVHYATEFCPWVVSHDSSSAIWNGVDERIINPNTLDVKGGKTPKHVDFNFNNSLNTSQTSAIEMNINVVRHVTGHAN